MRTKGSNKGQNKWVIEGNIAKIFFRNGDYFICDVEDLHLFTDHHTWRQGTYGYPIANIDGKNVTAHIFLLGKQEGMQIDHINRKRWDNRRCNLRFVTPEQNARNTRLTKKEGAGVYFRKTSYIAAIHLKDKTVHLGSFKTYEEAVKARKEAEFFYWGEQANEA